MTNSEIVINKISNYLITHIPIDKFFLEDPELDEKVPLMYLSHKEVYEHSIKKLAKFLKKIKEYQGNDLIDNNTL